MDIIKITDEIPVLSCEQRMKLDSIKIYEVESVKRFIILSEKFTELPTDKADDSIQDLLEILRDLQLIKYMIIKRDLESEIEKRIKELKADYFDALRYYNELINPII